MNLHSRKARLPIAALGVTALCTTGLGVVATSAFAQSSLTMTPATTSVNMLDTGAVIGSAGHTAGSFDITSPTSPSTAAALALAKTTYAMRISSVNDNVKVSLDSYTTPTGTAPSAVANALYFQATNSDIAPVAGWTGIGSNATTATVNSTAFNTNATTTPYVYLAPTQPGTYHVHLVDTQGTTATDDDVSAPSVTLNVKDVEAVTSSDTTDDWAPSVTNNTSSTGIGAPITTTVGLSSLTLVDGRGSSLGKGVLGDALATLTGVSFAGAGVSATTYAAVSNPAGTVLLPAGATTTAASALVATAKFDYDGAGFSATTNTLGTATTTVTSNNVSAVTAPAATAVTGSVAQPGGAGTAVSLKPGTGAATYTTTVTDADADKSGNIVYWTLGGTASVVAGLTTDGTAVDTTSSTTQKIFSSSTNSLGVASLTVTSGTTTAAATYTVVAQSNGLPSSPVTVNATYTASTLTSSLGSIISQNTSAELNPVAAAGISVVLKGKALDQYGAAYVPASNLTQTVTVAVGGTAICNAVIGSDGTFSCTYTPTTTPASGSNVTYTYAYNGSTLFTGTINFASATTATAVTLTTPANAATATVAKASTALPAGVAVAGKVTDANSAGLAYKQVVLTGTGVKFSTSGTPTTSSTTDDLVDSLTTTTDASGNITGAYVYYLGTGSDTVKATVGTVSATSTVTVAAPTVPDPFKVTVNDVSGNPGSTLIITGSVVDGFGNPAPGAKVLLGTGTSTLGSFGNSTPITNTLGIYSTTFITGSNQSGTADLTATLYDGTGSTLLTSATNPKPAVSWLNNGGLVIPTGEYTDQAKITLSSQEVTISTTGSLVGGGKAQLSGNAAPNSSVEVWAKPSGAAGFSLVGTRPVDADGTWGVGTTLTKTTAFFVKNGATVSPTVATVVYSYETLKAKALGKGKVEFKVYGVPNVKGIVNVYYGSKRLAHVASDSHGDATVTVQSSKGRKTFTVYFVAPGTSLKGKALTGTVK